MQLRSLLLAALRVLWAVAPLLTGATFADALDARSASVQVVCSAILWTAWAIALLATLVPAPLSLTVMRMLMAAGAITTTAVAGTAADDLTSEGAVGVIAVTGAIVTIAAAVLAFTPETGIRFVNGVAYPNERRFPLRVPAPLLLGPLPITGVVAVAGLPAAALLLAARQWVPGAIVAMVALPLTIVLARALHGLARRWLVFVPAGVVVHDPMSLTDPVLFPRATIVSLGPAPADSAATDLTQRAMGLSLELRVHEPASLSLVYPGRKRTENVAVRALLVTPTRPGAVMDEAARRQIGRTATPPPSTTSPS